MDESRKITWYKSALKADDLKRLTVRSNFRASIQTFGYLGLLLLSGATTFLTFRSVPIGISIVLIFIHGTFWAFLLNGFHELTHGTVFRTKKQNLFFLKLFGFLGWFNYAFFQASHVEHHKYTLHPPDDLEVTLPIKFTLKDFLLKSFVNPIGFVQRVKGYVKTASGRVEGEWALYLFPEEAVEKRRKLRNFARLTLIGHALIVAVSGIFGLWLIPVLVTLAPFYGSWLLYLCNNTQHVGLQDNVPDFRLCARTILINPFLRFLYWQMNYHIEHHMYAAVPCYHLRKLHKLIESDLPPSPKGLVNTWKEIIAILRKQKTDPAYQYVAPLPE